MLLAQAFMVYSRDLAHRWWHLHLFAYSPETNTEKSQRLSYMSDISWMGIFHKTLEQDIKHAQQCKSMYILLGMGEECIVFCRKLEYL